MVDRRSKNGLKLFHLVLPLGMLAVAPPPVRGAGVVAADHELASRCGAQMLAGGGNAVDAAVAAALCAGVVQPASSGLGGGGFALIRIDGVPAVLDFREVAPLAAQRDMFRGPDGVVEPALSQDGALAVAVPAESRGLARLQGEHGNLSFRDVAAPAVELARQGFEIRSHLGDRMEATRYEEVRRALSPYGVPLVAGDWLVRADLAETLQRWAATRGEDLATGRGARAMADHVHRSGGLLTADDLAAYEVKLREPVTVQYRGWTVITMPPPSSGGVVLAQMLRVLEDQDVAALGQNSSAYVHLLAEVMQHAYADRARWLGDPDFVDVPVARLLSNERVAEIRAALDPGHTWPVERYGPRIAPREDAGTEHISVIDAQGNMVALTTTINTAFGSGLVVPRTGVILNDQMDDFSAAPGVPNAYGLIGDEANSIAPGKRPLSSMTPTLLISPDGRRTISIGASGGSAIISAVVQVILGIIEFGLDPQQAVAMPRVHHQWLPHELVLEPEIPVDVREALQVRGHELRVARAPTSVQVVVSDGGGWTIGGSDPRKGGLPAAAGRP